MADNSLTLHLARDEAFCHGKHELEDRLTHVQNGQSVMLCLGKSSLAGEVLDGLS